MSKAVLLVQSPLLVSNLASVSGVGLVGTMSMHGDTNEGALIPKAVCFFNVPSSLEGLLTSF